MKVKELPIEKMNRLKEIAKAVIRTNFLMAIVGYSTLASVYFPMLLVFSAAMFFFLWIMVPILLFINLLAVAGTIVAGIKSGSVIGYVKSWGLSPRFIWFGIISSLLFYIGAALFYIVLSNPFILSFINPGLFDDG